MEAGSVFSADTKRLTSQAFQAPLFCANVEQWKDSRDRRNNVVPVKMAQLGQVNEQMSEWYQATETGALERLRIGQSLSEDGTKVVVPHFASI